MAREKNHPTGGLPEARGLYDPENEHDSCGVGFVAHMKGEPSHQLVLDADDILQAMTHRGGCGCDPNTGDGAGFLTGLPHEFLAKVAAADLGTTLPAPGEFAAGNIFLPTRDDERAKCKAEIERIIAEQGQTLLA